MNPEEIHQVAVQIKDQIATSYPWALSLLAAAIGSCVGAFASELGKNRATKKDIGVITEKIETVRFEFTKLEAHLSAQQEMRTACLDERLRVHQEAFVHYRKILGVMNNQTKAQILSSQLESWWEQKCLYLDAGPRDSFLRTIRMLITHHLFTDPETVKKDWEMVMELGKTITKAAGLPPIAAEEDVVKESMKAST